MAITVSLRGRNALSPFRFDKLMLALTGVLPTVSHLHAEYWHFVSLPRALDAGETSRIEEILTYGPASQLESPEGELLLVLPRFGTISPWSSKATDIAKHCGLEVVERIERGVAFYLRKQDGSALTAAEKAVILPLIHDRMTETVCD